MISSTLARSSPSRAILSSSASTRALAQVRGRLLCSRLSAGSGAAARISSGCRSRTPRAVNVDRRRPAVRICPTHDATDPANDTVSSGYTRSTLCRRIDGQLQLLERTGADLRHERAHLEIDRLGRAHHLHQPIVAAQHLEQRHVRFVADAEEIGARALGRAEWPRGARRTTRRFCALAIGPSVALASLSSTM